MTSTDYAKQVNMLLTNNIISSKSFDDENYNSIISQLNTLPYEWIVSNLAGARIKWNNYGNLALYRKYSQDGIVFDFDNLKRNDILRFWVENNWIDIAEGNRISQCKDFFYGFDVYFKIKGKDELLVFTRSGNIGFCRAGGDIPLLVPVERNKAYKKTFIELIEKKLCEFKKTNSFFSKKVIYP